MLLPVFGRWLIILNKLQVRTGKDRNWLVLRWLKFISLFLFSFFLISIPLRFHYMSKIETVPHPSLDTIDQTENCRQKFELHLVSTSYIFPYISHTVQLVFYLQVIVWTWTFLYLHTACNINNILTKFLYMPQNNKGNHYVNRLPYQFTVLVIEVEVNKFCMQP